MLEVKEKVEEAEAEEEEEEKEKKLHPTHLFSCKFEIDLSHVGFYLSWK